MAVQAMEDASPTKWHLAHVTWFFETFILSEFIPGYRVFDEAFGFCFNSYYEALGPRQPRSARGVLTRPSADQVLAYRAHVDEALEDLLAGEVAARTELKDLVELGINHEQQHQELMPHRYSCPLRRKSVAAGVSSEATAPDATSAGSCRLDRV